ncbi:MAG: 50S ribosomal protein L25/general stress protein Ctc [Actinomycetota bacterium]|nr:50S ribosomal protein L25/general stress protein Ctc [Actinomycetota bacterium]
MEEIKLKAAVRKETGKGPARRARLAGEIPGVLYGPGTEPVPLLVKSKDLMEVLYHEGGLSALINLEIKAGREKKNQLVMIKEVQKHLLKDMVLHVDFLGVARERKITIRVPVVVTGEEKSEGIKEGGIVQHNLWEVEVECLPTDIPESLPVDISQLNIGQHLLVSDLQPPAGVTVLNPPDEIVTAILAPRIVTAEEEAEEEEVAAAPEAEETEEQP